MTDRKTVSFSGVSSKVRGHLTCEESYKPPTPPRSILTLKHRAVNSPSPLSVDSVESDEVFVPVIGTNSLGIEVTNDHTVSKEDITITESESVSDDSNSQGNADLVPTRNNTNSNNTTQLGTRTHHPPTTTSQNTVLTDIYSQSGGDPCHQKDYYAEQYYSVSSPRGPGGGVEVKGYRLEKDHSHHREKVNKKKFERLEESFRVKLGSAEQSWRSRNLSGFTTNFGSHKGEREFRGTQEGTNYNISKKYDTKQVVDSKRSPRVDSVLNRGKISNRLNSTDNYHCYGSARGVISSKNCRSRELSRFQEEKEASGTAEMSESILAEPRLYEKQELQSLNARLSQYIRHMREMKENAGYLDSQVFLESVTVLEEELNNLKNMYEKELDSARIQIDDITRSKSHYELEEKKAKSLASELKNRLEIECGRIQKLQVEINSLQRLLAQREMQIEEGRIAIQTPINDLDSLQREYNKMRRDHEELKKRFDKEQLARQDAEDRSDTMKKKMDFQALINEQEKKELNDRLTSANGTIMALEERVREMSHHDQTLVEMLKRVRESAEEELRKYQEESEERHSRHLTELKAQIDEDDRRISELTDEQLRLNADITGYLGRIRELEGEVGSLDHQRKSLMDQLNGEKQRAQNHMKKMEFKLRELQDVLINKMRELNAARDAQIPLKAEIESFKSLIEEEERRLRIGPGEFPELPIIPPSYKKVAFTSSNSPVNMPRSEGYGVRPVTQNVRGYEESQPSPRPLGPIRIKSAPATSIRQKHQQQLNLVPSNLGQGRDYFDEMFKDLKLSDSQRVHDSPPVVPSPPLHAKSPSLALDSQGRPTNMSYQARSSAAAVEQVSPTNSCSVGDMKIHEVHRDGQYISLINTSHLKDEELGGHMIQQNVGGHPVAVYRFPNKLRCGNNEVVTVWSGSTDHSQHKPPSDFVFKEQQKWGTGPECTTILCKPNGQAIAWTTAGQRYSRDLYNDLSVHNSPVAEQEEEGNINNNNDILDMTTKEETLPEYDMNINGERSEPLYLRREKENPPSLNAPRHPHGMPPPDHAHPTTGQGRSLTYGNDNSSMNRQSRVQNPRPDPVPGAPYAGASAQRMGAAALRRFQPTSTANKASCIY